MARLENVDFHGKTTGWDVDSIGLDNGFVATQARPRSRWYSDLELA